MEYQNYRPSRDATYLMIADIIGRRGTCGRAQVGCAITIENRIVSTGYNGPPTGTPHCVDPHCDTSKTCTRAVHAEVNAIAFAAKHGISTNGGTLYCIYAPCRNCALLIAQSGIKRVVYIHPYKTNDGEELLKNLNIEIQQFHGDLL